MVEGRKKERVIRSERGERGSGGEIRYIKVKIYISMDIFFDF